jgi:hypothetical protein
MKRRAGAIKSVTAAGCTAPGCGQHAAEAGVRRLERQSPSQSDQIRPRSCRPSAGFAGRVRTMGAHRSGMPAWNYPYGTRRCALEAYSGLGPWRVLRWVEACSDVSL